MIGESYLGSIVTLCQTLFHGISKQLVINTDNRNNHKRHKIGLKTHLPMFQGIPQIII